MTEFNVRISAVTPSVTMVLTSKAKAMKAEGEDVCGFAAGEPDFDTPEHIKAACVQALGEGHTKYAPVAGLMPLRKGIAQKLKDENGLSYEPSQIVVSNGAKHSVANVIMAICRDGDEVVIPTPAWLSYPEMVKIAGANPIMTPTSEERDFAMTADELRGAITDKTRAVILNSPSNPTGAVYTRDQLEKLAEVIVENDLLVISDEIYEDIIYDGATHVSIGSLSQEILDRTITINGFSKAYSMTGWRLGYLAAPQAIADCVSRLQSHTTSGANTFAQMGAIAALEGKKEVVKEMVKAFEKRRKYMYEALMQIEGIACVKPMGAFYMFPNISCTGLDAMEFAGQLLENKKVAVVPGTPFGATHNVRLSYACDMETIEKGMDRFAKFVQEQGG